MGRKKKDTGRGQTVSRRTVAEAAGVSLTTVTHALNPPPGVRMSEATRARVLQVAKKLGYRPNFTGRALVSGKTFAVGLLQPRISSMYYRLYQDIVIGLTEAMQPDDYHPLLLFRTDDDQCLRPIQQGRVDGVLILQSGTDTRLVDKVVSSGDHPFEIGRAIPLKKGKDILFVTTGITTQRGLDAAEELQRQGIDAGVLHMHTVKPLDTELLVMVLLVNWPTWPPAAITESVIVPPVNRTS